MRAFITTGTKQFLEKRIQKFPQFDFYFMHATTKTLVYYEHERKNVFVSGRAYDVIFNSGDIQLEGYVVMNHIPVDPESRAVFEDEWKRNAHTFLNQAGCNTIRILRPRKGHEYIIFTQWTSEPYYQTWEVSDHYKQMQERIHKPAYFAKRPFTHTYYMKEDEE